MARSIVQSRAKRHGRWCRASIDAMLGVMRVVLTVVSSLALTSVGFAYVRYLTDEGVPVRWFIDDVALVVGPVPAPIDSAEAMGALRAAIDMWSAPETQDAAWTNCAPPTITSAVSTSAVIDDDGINSLVWFTDAALWNTRFSSLELARTLIVHRVLSGTIVDADIAVNIGGYPFSTGAACVVDRYDLRSVLTHELGHFFGLDHSLDPEATMRARNEPGDCEMRTLHADDIAGVCATYDRPPPVEPEPAVEPEPQSERVEIAEADVVERATPGSNDDGCHGGATSLIGLVIYASRRMRELGRGRGREVSVRLRVSVRPRLAVVRRALRARR